MKNKLSRPIGECFGSNLDICGDNSSNAINNEPIKLRRSKRSRKARDFGDDFYTFLLEDDPKTYNEAMMSVDALFWKKTVNDEMNSLRINKTWVLSDLPPGCKTIGCKWIFRKKLRIDGSLEKFKARLVAKGFKQEVGVDFFNTYLHVSKITTIRTLIVIVSFYKLEIHQMNVKIAFLNDDLEEKNFMD